MVGIPSDHIDIHEDMDKLTDLELGILYSAVKTFPGEGAALVAVVLELKKRNLWEGTIDEGDPI